MRKRLSSSPSRTVDLLSYLAERFTYYSYNNWIELLGSGNLSIEGIVVYENRILNPGQRIEFNLPINECYEPNVETKWELLYEDQNILAINKPGDLPIHPCGRYNENTLLRLIEKKFQGTTIHTIHRLDRETSGIVIFSKDKISARILSKDFQNQNVKKMYLVWVFGEFPEGLLKFRGFLRPDINSVVRKKLQFHKDVTGNVETRLKRIGFRDGISLLLALPITGKTHQIRSTLQSIGYPVLGDKLYGKRDTAFLDFIDSGLSDKLVAELGYHRQALHALSLEFNHPMTGVRMDLVAPLPRMEIQNSIQTIES